MPPVTTWADGFGVWHVRVSKHAASPLIAARRALRDELLARDSNVAQSVWMHPERVPERDTEDTVVYREGKPATDDLGDYTLHVTFRATHDRAAIGKAHMMLRALVKVPRTYIRNELPVVTTSDWTQQVTDTQSQEDTRP